MSDANQHTLTEQVLQRLANCSDARTRQINEALVRHLHAFIREIEPGFDEWLAAINFLTDVGHMCDGKRQEFILLSDVLGASMLVDSINHRLPAAATESTVLGPFYVEGPRKYPLGADITEGSQGTPMLVLGTVKNIKGQPLTHATVDVWHSDADGFYDVQHLPGFALRARFATDEKGGFHFWTLRPTAYPVPSDGPVGKMLRLQGRHPYRPAHVHFMIEAPDYQRLVTHVFASGDQYLDSDVVFGVKRSLIRDYVMHAAGKAPDGRLVDQEYAVLSYDFVLGHQ
jgi:hydroxyquinol 1,2-dioxygenase